jgi:hypothetical protein
MFNLTAENAKSAEIKLIPAFAFFAFSAVKIQWRNLGGLGWQFGKQFRIVAVTRSDKKNLRT